MASGVSHWHRENVDFEILKRLAIPGGIGAFAGATFLSSIDLSGGTIFISTILLLLGFVLLYRNVFQTNIKPNMAELDNPKYLTFLGATGVSANSASMRYIPALSSMTVSFWFWANDACVRPIRQEATRTFKYLFAIFVEDLK